MSVHSDQVLKPCVVDHTHNGSAVGFGSSFAVPTGPAKTLKVRRARSTGCSDLLLLQGECVV